MSASAAIDENVFRGEAVLFEVVDGEARVVLGTFLRAEDRGNAARDEPLHELGVRAVRRRAFRGVEDAEAA